MSTFAPWKILHIELNKGIPTLMAEAKYQGIYAVFWWYGIPLGHQEISADQLPMPALSLGNLIVKTITPTVGCHLLDHGFQAPLPVISENPSRDKPVDFHALITLQQPLKLLQERCSQPVSNSVSIVVCTRNRPQQLAQCLRSLSSLSQRPQQIIVVDNAPADDATRQVVAQMPGIQYVLEPRPGLSVARNTGIHHSTGDIIAFTDDDVVVLPDWITRLQQGFENPKVMTVTGLVLPGELETEAQVAFEKGFGGFSQGYRVLTFDTQFFEEMKHRGVPVWRIGAGANMAFRRKAFELLGYFDERLGAGASGCSEDSEFWYRILAEGWICHYEPTAVVYHYHRSDLDTFKQQMYQYTRGHVAALLVQFAKYKHWGNLHRLFVALPKYYTRRFLFALFNGFKSFNKMLLAEVSGCFSGINFYLKHSYTNVTQAKKRFD
ncbi:glycosyl transferase, group 2 family protein [Tolypothrix sp. NIES-4075]|uniref:glycosyltransferase family 2 protein n=1 Tax=Tolypothrix sp. NIES-4075 TaxID=2005459 RepID=UPI000B5C1F1B|nr:glycosyltransferase [Tolypothrix sp. NIES-4075]GAX42588.1 glycosyl transferase, group 2 family protein [Tolypothrix sp. NIES-4075]